MDAEVESFVRERVPGIADKVFARIRQCVNADDADVGDADIPLGHSKLCGRPDAPGDFEWPAVDDVPCWFIAQFNLAEMRLLKTGFRLPRAGLLSFFYHEDSGPPGPGSRVYLFPPKGLRRTDVVVDPRYGTRFHNSHLHPRLLTLSQGYRLPDEIRRYGLTPRERAVWADPNDPRAPAVIGRDEPENFDYFHEMFHRRFSPTIHRLFGVPRFEAKYPAPRGHQLLATFGQMGDRLNFYVRKEDLDQMVFGQVKVVLECT